MPPSAHYLNLLNLNQNDDLTQQTEFSNEDIAKELELFTNSNFLDSEPFFNQAFDPSTFENQANAQAYDAQFANARARQQGTLPRNQKAQFQAPVQSNHQEITHNNNHNNLEYLNHFNYTSPVSTKRTADEADIQTPASSDAGFDDKRVRSLDDEDKRRRNTAASARFRIKKKQREQALQENAKAMTDRNTQLENRVRELELENKWLRSLLKPVNVEQSKNVLASL